MVVPVSAARRSIRSRKSRSTAAGSVPGSQRRVPFEPGLLGILIEDLAGVDLADEDARRIRRPGAVRFAELVVEPAEPRDQFGGGGDHARLGGGSHDFVDRRALGGERSSFPGGASHGRRPASTSRSGSGSKTASPTVAVANHPVELTAVTPGGFVEVMGRQQGPSRMAGPPASRSARTASIAAAMPAFMSDAPLPVIWPASTPGRDERQVHRIEVAVELEGRSGPAAIESGRDGRGHGMPRLDSMHVKPVGLEDLRQPVAHGPGITGRARDLDQSQCRLDQPAPVYVRLQAFEDRGCRIHEGRL